MRGSGRVFIKGGAESHAVNERVQDRWQRVGWERDERVIPWGDVGRELMTLRARVKDP